MREVVAGEAMKPFLDYGWQPQVMAVEGTSQSDPGRASSRSTTSPPIPARRTISPRARISRARARGAAGLSDSVDGCAAERVESRRRGARKLAASATSAPVAKPVVRTGRAAARRHGAAVPDPRRGGAALRPRAVRASDPAARTDPREGSAQPRLPRCASPPPTPRSATSRRRSPRIERAQVDRARIRPTCARTWRCTTRARAEWPKAVPMLERIVAETPDKVPALEALALLRERQGQIRRRRPPSPEALHAALPHSPPSFRASARCRWPSARPRRRIESFEKARALRRARRSSTISSSASSTSRRSVSTMRATRSTASRRRIRTIRWRSSNARRSACCCTSRTRRRASPPRARTRTR